VLIVDDDRSMTRTLGDVLRLKSWEVTAVHSGEEALAAIDRRAFSVVLMDVRMNGITGVEALKRIRERRPSARVILMTAYSANELIEEARVAGVLDVLDKPVLIPQLLKLMERDPWRHGPVLVVDDDPDFLRALCRGLETHQVPTRRASSLDEAVRLLEASKDIEVVLLDLKLDGLMDAESVLAVREARPAVMVILFSGYPTAMEEVVAELPDGAVVASLRKPFDPDHLLGILERLHAR
jgi:DNA-binding NtrC family response regulator